MEKSIGALWAKKSRNGEYFTGNIEVGGEKIAIVAFYNANKKNPKEPDYRILKSKPMGEQIVDNSAPNRLNGLPDEEINPDDIPF